MTSWAGSRVFGQDFDPAPSSTVECPEMNRDMDLIRDLLFRISDDPRFNGFAWIAFDQSEDLCGHPPEEVIYHLKLLAQANFVEVELGGTPPRVAGLTWDGHEFLANITNKEVCGETKDALAKFGNVGLTIVASIAESIIKKKLNLP